MAAVGGNRLISVFASTTAVLLTGSLAGCEYSPREEPAAPAASGGSSGTATGRDEATADALLELLGLPDPKGLAYHTGPTASLAAEVERGQYLLTAGCVGSSGADVSVSLGNSAPETYSFPCGMGKVIYLDHPGGSVLAEAVPQPAPGALAGLKIEHHPAPRDMQARKETWMREQLGPEKPGEFRRFLSSGEAVATGPLASGGTYDLALVCSGPESVELTVITASGEPVLGLVGVPCGSIFRTVLRLDLEGIQVLLDAGKSPSQAAVSILPANAAGS